SSERGTNRDALSRLRVARISGLLSRLASAGSGNSGGSRRSRGTRDFLSPIGVRSADGQSLALGGTCGLGDFRRRDPGQVLSPRGGGTLGDFHATGVHGGKHHSAGASQGRSGERQPG